MENGTKCCIPDWNDIVKGEYDTDKDAYLLSKLSGNPRVGVIMTKEVSKQYIEKCINSRYE